MVWAMDVSADFDRISENRIRELLRDAPQPVPWVPDVRHRWRGQQLQWSESSEDKMARVLEDAGDHILLAVGGYVRVGWPDDTHVVLISDGDETVEIAGFVIDNLEPLADLSPVGRNTYESGPEPLFRLSAPKSLEPGRHALSGDGVRLGEQLAFVSTTIRGSEECPWSLWSFDLVEPSATIVPQVWFSGPGWDFGYEWPTVAAHDPESGLIVGWGFRLGFIVLDETGETLLQRVV